MDTRPARPERERRGTLEIFLIGAFFAALFAGGIKLLGDTNVAFNAKQDAQASRAAKIRAGILDEEARMLAQREAQAQVAGIRASQEAEARAAEKSMIDTRCIGGTLFKVEGSSYTNIGRC